MQGVALPGTCIGVPFSHNHSVEAMRIFKIEIPFI